MCLNHTRALPAGAHGCWLGGVRVSLPAAFRVTFSCLLFCSLTTVSLGEIFFFFIFHALGLIWILESECWYLSLILKTIQLLFLQILALLYYLFLFLELQLRCHWASSLCSPCLLACLACLLRAVFLCCVLGRLLHICGPMHWLFNTSISRRSAFFPHSLGGQLKNLGPLNSLFNLL